VYNGAGLQSMVAVVLGLALNQGRRQPPQALHSPGRAARGDHCREPPQGVHGRGRHAWQPPMSWQTAGLRHNGHASCRHLGGPAAPKLVSFSDPLGSSPLQQEQPRITPETPTPWGGFCTPRAPAPSQPPQRRYPQCQQKPPTRIDL
jgi:hypothetical protein